MTISTMPGRAMKPGKSALAAVFASLLTLAASGPVAAQTSVVPDGDNSPNLLTRPYLTPTGQVVPKPGEPQTGPQTPQEKKAQHQSDQILNSICSNC